MSYLCALRSGLVLQGLSSHIKLIQMDEVARLKMHAPYAGKMPVLCYKIHTHELDASHLADGFFWDMRRLAAHQNHPHPQ